MKIKTLILLAILSGSAFSGIAQRVLMEEKVKDYAVLDKNGPNLKRFDYMTFGFGLLLPVSDTTAHILIPSSYYLTLGYRHKTKINNYLSVGLDMNLNYSQFALRQDSRKKLPDTVLHDKQHLGFYKFGFGGYLRINFDKRGNNLGKYLDLGVLADLTFSSKNRTKDHIDGYNVKTTIRGMKPYETFNYNLVTRLGFNKIVFTASYRMLSVYKKDYYVSGSELPPLSAGIEIALF